MVWRDSAANQPLLAENGIQETLMRATASVRVGQPLSGRVVGYLKACILLMKLKLLKAERCANCPQGLPCLVPYPATEHDMSSRQSCCIHEPSSVSIGTKTQPCMQALAAHCWPFIQVRSLQMNTACMLMCRMLLLHSFAVTGLPMHVHGRHNAHGVLLSVCEDLAQQRNGRGILPLTQAIGYLMPEQGRVYC